MQNRQHPIEIKGCNIGTNGRIDFGKSMQDPLFKLRHIVMRYFFPLRQSVDGAQQVTQCISETAIEIADLFQNFRTDA